MADNYISYLVSSGSVDRKEHSLPVGGGVSLFGCQHTIFAKISKTMHEIVKILKHRGALLDPSLKMS